MSLKKTALAFLTAALCLNALAAESMTDQVKSWFRSDAKTRPQLRVLVERDLSHMNLEVEGKFRIFDPRTKTRLMSKKFGKASRLEVLEDGLKWGERFPGVHQFVIIPFDEKTKILVNGKEYVGSLYVYEVEGRLSAVNKVELEDYLVSVLTPLFPTPVTEELLAASAIVARTNAYFLAENPSNPYWAIDANSTGFVGYVPHDDSSLIQRAVRNTKHMILSRDQSYEGIANPFPAVWKDQPNKPSSSRQIYSKISLKEADEYAMRGHDASAILARAFPEAIIQLISYDPQPSQ